MNAEFTLPDGSTLEKPYGTTPGDIAESIGPALARDAVAARVDGTPMDLDVPLEQDADIDIITSDSDEGLEILRHSTAHVMACAVSRLYSNVKFGIGPAIEDGFYYDFDLDESISADHLERIEEEMGRIRSEEMPFERQEVPVREARRMLEDRGQSYKLELLDDLEVETVSLYSTGDFLDLCRGPHVPHTGKTPPFTLLSVAGAYWRGSEENPQLQRIYGTAFSTEEELEEYLERREEAAKRDHRDIGQQLDLFSSDEEIGQGFILWHPRGARIRETIESYWKSLHAEKGYSLVSTPHLANEDIFRRSGHIPKYEDMMYAPLDIEGDRYRVKPMNCPGHIKIYKSQLRSYRDLPIRYAELGTVYRHEPSGTLHGMLRVRGFTQDDAHVFCTPEQLPGEIETILQMVEQMMDAFGFDYHPSLATRPEESLQTASDEQWEQATDSLRQALEARGLEYDIDEGEGTFYAPKIDVKLYDALGREWQGPTIQVDLNLPKRFDVSYVGDDNEEHECVIVHRAILGSLERFVGMLIEHFAGWFPVWLAPEQVRVLPITDEHMDYARSVRDTLREAGLRATCDERNEKTGYKVHSGTEDKVPFMLIVGDREVENGTVSVRSHENGDEGAVELQEFVDRITAEIESKRLPEEVTD